MAKRRKKAAKANERRPRSKSGKLLVFPFFGLRRSSVEDYVIRAGGVTCWYAIFANCHAGASGPG